MLLTSSDVARTGVYRPVTSPIFPAILPSNCTTMPFFTGKPSIIMSASLPYPCAATDDAVTQVVHHVIPQVPAVVRMAFARRRGRRRTGATRFHARSTNDVGDVRAGLRLVPLLFPFGLPAVLPPTLGIHARRLRGGEADVRAEVRCSFFRCSCPCRGLHARPFRSGSTDVRAAGLILGFPLRAAVGDRKSFASSAAKSTSSSSSRPRLRAMAIGCGLTRAVGPARNKQVSIHGDSV